MIANSFPSQSPHFNLQGTEGESLPPTDIPAPEREVELGEPGLGHADSLIKVRGLELGSLRSFSA